MPNRRLPAWRCAPRKGNGVARVRTSQHRSPIPTFPKGKEPFKPPKTQQVGAPAPWGRAGEGLLGNSEGVAISQPRVEGRSTSTLGIHIIRYSNAVSIAISQRRYPNANPSLPICRGIIQLSITPTAKRNSYRVAILVGALPRVAGHVRNPGLCNRNSVRVAGGAYLLLSTKGNEQQQSLHNFHQRRRKAIHHRVMHWDRTHSHWRIFGWGLCLRWP